MKPLTIMSLVVVALVTVLAACSAESVPEESAPTSVAGEPSDESLVFGSGSIPETVPAEFPVPSEARVSSTMVDRTRGVTEFIVVFPAEITEVVEYFETNLSAVGYTVDESSGSDTRWVIEFSTDGLDGSIVIEASGGGVSQGTVRLVQPVSG